MSLLSIIGLTKRFKGLSALSDVSFDVARGEIVGLVGPNGAGKSTCFHCATGFLKPTAGSVIFDGAEVTGLSPHRLARRGLVRSFQQSAAFMELTVEENLRTACYLRDGSSLWSSIVQGRRFRATESAIERSAMQLCSRLGLDNVLATRAADLSYGHLRKLGIGIALATQPKCLMLDEPAAGLNPAESKELLGLLRDVRTEGIGIVIVEHDMKLIMSLCDRVVVLSSGRKIAEGSPKTVREDPEVIRSYLGTRRYRHVAEHAQN